MAGISYGDGPLKSIGHTDQIRHELSRRRDELRDLTRELLLGLKLDDKSRRRLYEFHQLTLSSIDRDDLLDWYCDYLKAIRQSTPKAEFVYELALWSSFRATPRAIRQFEWLWELGDKRRNLAGVRDRNLSIPYRNRIGAASSERGPRNEQRRKLIHAPKIVRILKNTNRTSGAVQT